MILSDVVGTTGVSLILLAYLLTVFKIILTEDLLYLLLNLVGAILAGLASVMISYVPFIVLEGAWAAVTFIALIRRLRKRNVTRSIPAEE